MEFSIICFHKITFLGPFAMDSADFDIVEVAGLGRPFQLGMAYDLRKHKLLPGTELGFNDSSRNTIQRYTKAGSALQTKATLLITTLSIPNVPLTAIGPYHHTVHETLP